VNAASSLVATALSWMTRNASKERLIVKTSLISATLVALLAAAAAGTIAFGQGAPLPHGQNIAVIDVGLIFEKHNRFNAQMAQLKTEIEQTEAGWKKEAQDINAMIEQIKTLKPDSPEYHRLEADITKRQADLKVTQQLQNKALMEKQSKIYLATYREVEGAVTELCHRFNVSLVIRYSSKGIDGSDPQEILRGIQRPIVYVDKQYDITGDILNSLNRSADVGARPTAFPK
jgi:Skp family chaperone for outer membrane proteins